MLSMLRGTRIIELLKTLHVIDDLQSPNRHVHSPPPTPLITAAPWGSSYAAGPPLPYAVDTALSPRAAQ